jgi:predicted permease
MSRHDSTGKHEPAGRERHSRDEDELPLSKVRPVDEDVRGELEFHLEQRALELQARGHAPEQARAMARELFGDRSMVEAECRDIESRRRLARRRSRRVEALRQDMRVAVRMLAKSPGFTAAAVITLALGIGGNAAVFSIVNRVILQPLPYQEADRLVTMTERHEKGWGNMPWANFLDIEAQSRSFAGMASYGSGTETVLGAATAVRVQGAVVSAGFFRVFPVHPVLGRLPLPDEHQRGATPVAVVSYAFWRDQLGSPSSLDSIRLRTEAEITVVGVLPPGFDFPDGSRIWIPMELRDQSPSRTSHNWDVVGRLAPGVTPLAAQREIDAILARLRPRYYPDFDAVGSTVTRLQDALTASTRKPLYLLLGASALLLLAACTNLAGATLARGTARGGELAVRSALGATRTRLVRQLLTESAILSVLGCAAGVALAVLLLRSLALLAPQSLPLADVHVDLWVLIFAGVVAVVTALLFGLLPALRLSESGTASMLREGSRGTVDSARLQSWNVLVAAEVALALVLLSGSSLLIRSFSRVMETKLGFDPDQVTTARVDLPAINYGDSLSVPRFHVRVLEALGRQPGVAAAGFANVLPLEGNNPSGGMLVESKPFDPGTPRGNGYAVYRVVGGDFFRAAGIPLVRGRVLGPGDDAAATPVVVVNETFVRTEWPNDDPIGKRVKPHGMDRYAEPWFTVVGVVGDVRGSSVIDPFREVYYFDHRQRPAHRTRTVIYVVRSPLDQSSVNALLRRAVAGADPQVPIELSPLHRLVAASVADRRFTTVVLGAFAAVAFFLAVIGVYAVVSYSVAQRTREIGVRMALGGTPSGVQRMVLTGAMRAVAPGLVLGAALTLASSRTLRSLLYGVSPLDVTALAAALLLLAFAAVASSVLPAIRATRVDPMVAIRAE